MAFLGLLPAGKWQESDGWIRSGNEPRSKRPPLTARVVRVVAAQKSGAMSAKPTPISQFLSVCMSRSRQDGEDAADDGEAYPAGLVFGQRLFRSQHDPEGLEMINDRREADRGTVERLNISQLTTKPNRSPAKAASVALDKEEAYGLPINRIECQAGSEGTPPSGAEETGGPSSDMPRRDRRDVILDRILSIASGPLYRRARDLWPCSDLQHGRSYRPSWKSPLLCRIDEGGRSPHVCVEAQWQG